MPGFTLHLFFSEKAYSKPFKSQSPLYNQELCSKKKKKKPRTKVDNDTSCLDKRNYKIMGKEKKSLLSLLLV